jgi:hypothetical protein
MSAINFPERYSGFAERIDRFMDYIPILSTISNLIDLFIKVIFLRKQSKEGEQTSPVPHQFKHLESKTFGDCVLLLVPVLGNIIVPIRRYERKQSAEKKQIRNLFVKYEENPNIGTLRKIAELGSPVAQRLLGEHYLLTMPPMGTIDVIKSLEDWIFNPDPTVQYKSCFANLSPENRAEAIKWLEKPAKRRDANAIHVLGLFYLDQYGETEGDVAKIWYAKASKLALQMRQDFSTLVNLTHLMYLKKMRKREQPSTYLRLTKA